jgi:hypothetical protein
LATLSTWPSQSLSFMSQISVSGTQSAPPEPALPPEPPLLPPEPPLLPPEPPLPPASAADELLFPGQPTLASPRRSIDGSASALKARERRCTMEASFLAD